MKRVSSYPFAFDSVHFGNVCEAHRIELKMTKYQVAALIDKSATYVAEMEIGRAKNPEIKGILALCNLYDLDIREFFILQDTRTQTMKVKNNELP